MIMRSTPRTGYSGNAAECISAEAKLLRMSLKNESREQVEADLRQLAEAPDIDGREIERRKELLQLYQNSPSREPIEFTSYSMKRRR